MDSFSPAVRITYVLNLSPDFLNHAAFPRQYPLAGQKGKFFIVSEESPQVLGRVLDCTREAGVMGFALDYLGRKAWPIPREKAHRLLLPHFPLVNLGKTVYGEHK